MTALPICKIEKFVVINCELSPPALTIVISYSHLIFPEREPIATQTTSTPNPPTTTAPITTTTPATTTTMAAQTMAAMTADPITEPLATTATTMLESQTPGPIMSPPITTMVSPITTPASATEGFLLHVVKQ